MHMCLDFYILPDPDYDYDITQSWRETMIQFKTWFG